MACAFKIQYLSDLGVSPGVCWNYVSPAVTLEEAEMHAVKGLAAAKDLFGAVAFQILDSAGAVVKRVARSAETAQA